MRKIDLVILLIIAISAAVFGLFSTFNINIAAGVAQVIAMIFAMAVYCVMVVSILRPAVEVFIVVKNWKNRSFSFGSVIRNYLPCTVFFLVSLLVMVTAASI